MKYNILIASRNGGIGIEFPENWVDSNDRNVAVVYDFDEVVTVDGLKALAKAEDECDDRGVTYVSAIAGMTLLFMDKDCMSKFKAACPGHRCRCRLATEFDKKMYELA